MSEERDFKVTEDDIEKAIVQEVYMRVGFRTTICVIILDTGEECVGSNSTFNVGESSVLDTKKLARKEAIEKVSNSIASIKYWQRSIYLSEKQMEEEKAKKETEKKEK